MSLLAGIGLTVSLLLAKLSVGQGRAHCDHAKVGILVASLLAALLAAAVLGTGINGAELLLADRSPYKNRIWKPPPRG